MNLLLDTCTFLWLALPQAKLSSTAVRLLNDPNCTLHFSDVSVWEIILKHTAGKLPLPDAPRDWIPSRLRYFQIHQLKLTREAVFISGELPQIHSDPFDRLLAAQALDEGFTLLSPDTPISNLGASRLW